MAATQQQLLLGSGLVETAQPGRHPVRRNNQLMSQQQMLEGGLSTAAIITRDSAPPLPSHDSAAIAGGWPGCRCRSPILKNGKHDSAPHSDEPD
jgi:hypothetical protein